MTSHQENGAKNIGGGGGAKKRGRKKKDNVPEHRKIN